MTDPIDINEARRRRERIEQITSWIMSSVPFTVPWRDFRAFHDRWPGLSAADLTAIAVAVQRRSAAVADPDCDLDALEQSLSGRYERWSSAANWLVRHSPDPDINGPDFLRHFGDLTSAEFILAVIEHQRRLKRMSAQ